MIYIGENRLSGVKLGDSEIPAIYCGEMRIYPFEDTCTYATFTANAEQTISFNNGSYEYSYNKASWKPLIGAVTFGTNKKETIYIRGENNNVGTAEFSTSAPVAVGGVANGLVNCNSLNTTTLSGKSLASLFSNATVITSVESGFLPATTLSDYCYQNMFKNCTSLTASPALPAVTLTQNCYDDMFEGCISLTTTPALPATTMAENSCSYMFKGCTGLTSISSFANATLADFCFQHMFEGCTSLTGVTELPATPLAEYCYYHMFEGCTSLVSAPLLPATTLAEWCYANMFQGCTGLTTAPELPATTMESACYTCMFQECTSLTTVPELPAATLAEWCYSSMFEGCTLLNEIHVDATDITAEGCTFYWLKDVASAGNFYGKDEAEWTTDTPHGIPVGWIKVPPKAWATFSATSEQSVLFGYGSFIYSYDSVYWSAATGAIAFGTDGKEKVYVAGNNNYVGTASFSTAAPVAVGGVANGLINCYLADTSTLSGKTLQSLFSDATVIKTIESGFLPATEFIENCYENMFYGCASLVNSPALPATTLVNYCYSNMFYGCTSLVNPPALPATILTRSCYESMFEECTSLTTAPELPATTLAYYCYSNMFNGCTSLTAVPATLPATAMTENCYRSMFQGCTSLTSAPTLPSTALANYCYRNMFKGCTSLAVAPTLPAATLVDYCYQSMFSGCSLINEIHVDATYIFASYCTNDWLAGVASAGTFYGKDASWGINTPNGIPVGWIRVPITWATFSATSEQTVSFNQGTYLYSYDSVHWSAATGAIAFGTSGKEKVYVAGNNNSVGTVSFSTAAPVAVGGVANGLINCYSGDTSTLSGKTLQSLFTGATALKSVESGFLPATTLTNYCYTSMFSGCTSLVNAPALPATTLTNSCYYSIFKGCTSLASAPALPATTLAYSCYANMFEGCTSLTSAPALPATTLAEFCYTSMFYGCNSLTSAPALPATTLMTYCYQNMFRGCTALKSAPELPATTLVTYCYQNMFNGCSLINEIHVSATSISASYCTYNWLENVASAGTFYGKDEAGWIENSPIGIPVGWIRVPKTWATFSATSEQSVSFYEGGFMYSYDNVHWFRATSPIVFGTSGKEKVYVAGNNDSVGTAEFSTSAPVAIGGVANGLINCYSTDNSTLSGKSLQSLFSYATALESVESGFLPATELTGSCYYGMFERCTALLNAPALPATTLANDCYASMFAFCTSLTAAPALPATTLANYCYNSMFSDCETLTAAPELPATTLANYCYHGMFQGCLSLTKAPKLPATALTVGCYVYMFYYCSNLTTAPELPATTLVDNCYKNMFENCNKLNEIHVDATDISADECTTDWLANVATAGTFYGKDEAGWIENSPSGIPVGWTTPPKVWATFSAASLQTVRFSEGEYKYSYDGKIWSAATGTIPFGFEGKEKVYVAGNNDSVGTASFSVNTSVAVGGVANGLINCYSTDTSTLNGKSLERLFYETYYISSVESGFLPATELTDGCYSYMFYNSPRLTAAPALPATVLTPNCYNSMFAVCTGLISTPELPSTELAESCYNSMFMACTSLKTAPELPATTLANYCYYSMFLNCFELTAAPTLPATTLANNCYERMFNGCFKLTSTPELPATTLADNCYRYMFSGCTSLTSIAELPATTLAKGCYNNMFSRCTKLATAPALPATTLAENCYSNMFDSCTSLTTAPVLPATTLANYCYRNMFSGCSLLNEVHVNATGVTGTNHTFNWLSNVADTGYFYGDINAGWATGSTNGIPVGWIMCPSTWATFSAVSEQTVTFSLGTYMYSYDTKNWSAATGAITFGTSGKEKVYVAGNNASAGTASFGTDVDVAVGGVANGLINCYSTDTSTLSGKSLSNLFYNDYVVASVESGFLPATELTDYCYSAMFYCSRIATAPALPATALTKNCYNSMFYRCFALTTTPELPATVLADYCYYQMFQNCWLTSITTLPATTMAKYCYTSMFSNCRKLTVAPALPATELAEGCYQQMFDGCSGLTTSPSSLPATALTNYCYGYMFRGCKSLTTAPTLPATTLVNNCYREMFNGCSLINEIHVSATSISASNCTTNWLANVASSGTFYGKDEAGWVTDSPNGIPVGWIRAPKIWATFSATSEQTVTFSQGTYMYSYDGTNWSAATGTITFGTDGKQKVYVAGDNNLAGTASFSTSSPVAVGGVANGLINCYSADTSTLSGKLLQSLFSGATALKSVENGFLPATTLTNYCYYGMFHGCTSLTTAPALTATTLTEGCYNSMFSGCTLLTSISELPATTLAASCYANMFSGCKSLTTAPALTVTALTEGCYNSMFQGCTSLTTAPELPATTLATYCYNRMFAGCTSLKIAPYLPATGLTKFCYQWMFQGCSLLNEIHVDAVNINAMLSTNGWLLNVASAGTFYGKDAGWELNSPNGVPSGWTAMPFIWATFSATTSQSVSFESGTYLYSYDSVYWSAATGAIAFGTDGKQKVYVAGNNESVGTASFSTSAPVAVGSVANGLINCYSGDTSTLGTKNLKSLFTDAAAIKTVESGFLPATTLSSSAYTGMFRGCTSLTTTPTLPATELTDYCYDNMFRDCSSLASAPSLPAATMKPRCYSYMFYGCEKLTSAPALSSTALAGGCYGRMFYGCTGLTTAPELPATTMESACYDGMFHDCTSLTKAPALPATTLAEWCYSNMFEGCTGLTTSPTLPATTLAACCYFQMFYDCSKLNEVFVSATDISASACTSNWLYGVASTGYFHGNKTAAWATGSTNGIPVGWTMVPSTWATFSATTSQTVRFSKGAYLYSYDTKNWSAVTYGTMAFGTSGKQKVYVAGNNASAGTAIFSTSAPVAVGGVANGLINCYSTDTSTLSGKSLANLFTGATAITSVESGFLPATTLTNYCYNSMFRGCSSLVNAPELPATALSISCYSSMFRGCTSLATAPTLPATAMTESCYAIMFQECTSLTISPALPATVLFYQCYYSMFQGCTGLTSTPELPATVLKSGCYQNMFYNCSKLNEVFVSATSISASNCTTNWLYGVASAGTFYGKDEAGWTTDSPNGIPVGWTTPPKVWATFSAASEQIVSFEYGEYKYCYEGTRWSAYTGAITFGTSGKEKVYVAGNNNSVGMADFGTSAPVAVGGVANGLINCYSTDTSTLSGKSLGELFLNATAITSVESGFLPATALTDYCYVSMFEYCTSLVKAPYLPATTLEYGCYENMFAGCSKLNEIHVDATGGNSSTNNWAYGVASTGDFYGKLSMSWETGENGIPNGWTEHLD